MLDFLIKILKAINSNSHPGEIAHAVCCGMILGFLPKENALWVILTVFFLFLRINKVFFVLSTVLFSLLAIILDPFFGTGTTGAVAKKYGRNFIGKRNRNFNRAWRRRRKSHRLGLRFDV